MSKMRALARQPAAVVVLLVLLGVTAHAATITVFTSLDDFQAQLGLPDLTFNFDNQPEGPPDIPGQLSLTGLTVAGPFRISNGAINFGYPPNAALGFRMNFSNNDVFAFGTNVEALSRAGTLNFSWDPVGASTSRGGGLSAIVNITSPGFVGFATDAPFRAINATFTPFPGDTANAANFVIDNVIVNTVRGVPAPATLVLLAAGAAFVAVRLYTRRRTPARGRGAQEGDASDPM